MTLYEPTTLEAVLRLALAFLLGWALGWVRERSRSAGMRTYPLLSLCTCGFLLLGRTAAGGPGEQQDVLFGVITGIGFVGSGAVMKTPDGAEGMSTAVSLWVTGAIGAGVAFGATSISVALVLLSLFGLRAPPLATRRRVARS